MKKLAVLNRIHEEKVMAIVRVDTLERAKEIAEGCLEGGVSILEISYTNNNAGEIIEKLHAIYGDDLLLGAGTVLDSETAREAMIKGAQFIIAPNFNSSVASICNRYHIPYMPGCFSLSEVVDALTAGADMIKAFPSSAFFGPQIVSAIKVPLPYVPILSSGGANTDNIVDWLEQGVDCLGIGTLLTKGSKAEIAENAGKIRAIVSNFKNKS
ncbi:bifunctional 4-hydroxy-2-oxoglutarate aldolase/2-dehydro-3-deoxy-phosphogluconate aldolase [Streptococcus devriesei]|uniref:bifunctional 4-hydroxy-2-oxoglutarate aldolase/2-dehydro-3-deoxy-phosphogluconate aldolase n=1 Tax=Streptococcus devriesei TaxID=231233 RepID=UPI000428F4A0|nr:bifunctional 4-hydroxy-2-oxoglutarate aldolase/2-dehydro-3-deoxy-phosphogluconate aldolase [Streptococcus devriesei]